MENQEIISQTDPKPKLPTLLIILSVLSGVSIFFGIISHLRTLFNGPLSKEGLEEITAIFYDSMANLQAEGAGESFIEMFQKIIDNMIYVNNEAFYLNGLLGILTLCVGAVSIVMMLKLRKMGFHLYILYSVLPILTLYLVSPVDLIPNLYVVWHTLSAALFSVLYGLNLKVMK